MRKLFLFCLPLLALSCNSGTATGDAAKDTTAASAAATPVNYPYTIDHPDNWEIGSSDNTMAALSGLKAWENNNMGESMKYFADSVQLLFDGIDATISNDSLKVLLGNQRNNYNSLQIKMEDWESVVSKDKSDEYVTLWYTEHWESKNGMKDSISIINDLKMKNGKIERLAEYTRKFH